jgi:hypothetical protein
MLGIDGGERPRYRSTDRLRDIEAKRQETELTTNYTAKASSSTSMKQAT